MNQNYNQSEPIEEDGYYLSQNDQLNGPFTLLQVEALVESSQFVPEDYIYHRDWNEWKQIEQVLTIRPDLETILGGDGQDPHVLEQSFNYLEANALPEEEIFYIAIQHAPARKITSAIKLPKSVILTNRRICVLEPKLIGEIAFDAHPIEYVDSVLRQIKRGATFGSLHIVSKYGSWRKINKIPLRQLEQLNELAHEILSNLPKKEYSVENEEERAKIA